MPPSAPLRTRRLAIQLRRLAAQLEARPDAPLPPQAAESLRRLEAALPPAGPPAARGAAPPGRAAQSAVPVAAAASAVPGGAPASIRAWGDGSCSPNPGPGGWGVVILRGGGREEAAGAAAQSTNNIMELTAAIEALGRIPPGAAVQLHSDSRYVVDGITKWARGWQRKGWRKSDGKPVLNRALWEELQALSQARRVEWRWVRGHAGDPENERCDALANQARLALGKTR